MDMLVSYGGGLRGRQGGYRVATRLIPALFFLCLQLVVVLPVMADEPISDPLEPINRGVFWVNERFDENVGEPVASAYDYVTPDPVQKSVRNFFTNLRFPIQVVSNLLQLRFADAADDTGRFLVNTTVGVGGLFDVYGGEYDRQDLGTVLASYGVPEGPYIVLPLLGPSNVRDSVGLVGAVFLDPLYWIYASDAFDSSTDTKLAVGLLTLEYINTRARYLDVFEQLKEDSLDYYLAQQSFYLQYRRGLTEGDAADDDWFEDEFDDEFEDEFEDELDDEIEDSDGPLPADEIVQ